MLNNKGWGLKEMLFFSGMILLIVLVVVVMVNDFYKQLEGGGIIEENPVSSSSKKSSVKSSNYVSLENTLRTATKKYINKVGSDKAGNIVISEDLINQKFISEKDMIVNGDTCEGYVLINGSEIHPFISCSNYETEGY